MKHLGDDSDSIVNSDSMGRGVDEVFQRLLARRWREEFEGSSEPALLFG